MSLEEDIQEFSRQSKEDMDFVVRHVVLAMGTEIIKRSPVGNPELWAENAHNAYAQQTHNLFVGALNESLGPGEKPVRRAGKATLSKNFPIKRPAGYTGGRFRGNWQLSADAPAEGALDVIDPSGNATIAKATSIAKALRAGGMIYWVNNLPYAYRLEYESWSKQAPAGMVRITAAEFQQYINNALRALRQ